MASRKDEKDDGTAKEVVAGELKREIGLFTATCLVAGSIIGSGIFVSPKGVLQNTGSVGLSLIVWIFGGVTALLGTLCYAEIGTMIPLSGGLYSYIKEGVGSLPAFLSIWSLVLLPVSTAVKALTFATYMMLLFDSCGESELLKRSIATALILGIGIINCYSNRFALRTQNFFTTTKLLALVVIIVGGIVMLAQGKTETLSTGFDGSITNPSKISLGFYSCAFAYSGWQHVNNIVEEMKNPPRTLPWSCVIGVTLVTIVYALTNISFYSVMSVDDVLTVDGVALTWAERVIGDAAKIMPLAVMASTFGSIAGTEFTTARQFFVAGRDGNLPEIMSCVHHESQTPIPALISKVILTLIMIHLGDIYALINLLSFVTWLFHALVFGIIIYFRWSRPDQHRPIKVPLVLTIIMCVVSMGLVILPLIDNPQLELLYGIGYIVLGVVIYFVVLYWHHSLPGTGAVSLWLQLITQTVSAAKEVRTSETEMEELQSKKDST